MDRETDSLPDQTDKVPIMAVGFQPLHLLPTLLRHPSPRAVQLVLSWHLHWGEGSSPIPPETPEGSIVTENIPILYSGQSGELVPFPSPLEMLGEGGQPRRWASNNDKDNNSIKG